MDRRRLRKILFLLISLTFGLLAPIFLFEVILHIIWKAPRLPIPVGLLKNDPYSYTMHTSDFHGMLNTPDCKIHFDTNSHGLRDLERPFIKPKNTYRLLAIGDSYVEGQCVEFDQLFLRQAEILLNKKLKDREYQIIKAGVGGWGPFNELGYLKSVGYRFNPDALLVVFFIGNDYGDAMFPDQFVEYHGIRLERSKFNQANKIMDLKIFLRKHIFSYGWSVDLLKGIMMSDKERYAEDITEICYCASS